MVLAKLHATVLVLLVAILLVPGLGDVVTPASGQTVSPGDKKPQVNIKWEYQALTDPDIEKLAPEGSRDKLTDGLNKLGDKGWELVTVVPGVRGGPFRPGFAGPGGPGGLPGVPGGMPGGIGAGMMAPHLTYLFKRPK